MIAIQIILPKIEIQVEEADKARGEMLAKLIAGELYKEENLQIIVNLVDKVKLEIFQKYEPKKE